MVVAAARTVFGMAAGGSFPRWLGAVHARRQTPWVATVAVAAAALLGILSGDIGFVAQITNVSILIVFFAVNLALIALRRKEPAQARPFRVPGQIAGVPYPCGLGMATCALLVATAGLVPILVGAGIAAGAMLFYVGAQQDWLHGRLPAGPLFPAATAEISRWSITHTALDAAARVFIDSA